jgi:hypothetical protein
MNNLYSLIVILLVIIVIFNFMFILKLKNCNMNENFENAIIQQQGDIVQGQQYQSQQQAQPQQGQQDQGQQYQSQQQGQQDPEQQQQGQQQQDSGQQQGIQMPLNLITLYNKNTQPVLISNQTPIGTPSNPWDIPDFNVTDSQAQWIWYKTVSNNGNSVINNSFTNALLIGINNNSTLKYPLTLNVICDSACIVFSMNETGINNLGYVSGGPDWKISTKFTLSRLSQNSIFIFLLANFGTKTTSNNGGFICSLQDSSNPVNIVFNSNITYFPNWSVWAS